MASISCLVAVVTSQLLFKQSIGSSGLKIHVSRVQVSFLASQSPHKVEGFFLGKMRAIQSIIELDLPESLADDIDESVRPKYI